jgi:hypothetical protein
MAKQAMSGRELVDALRMSGTGEGKLKPATDYLADVPKADAAEVFEHLCDELGEAHAVTLAKAKYLMDGGSTRSFEPDDGRLPQLVVPRVGPDQLAEVRRHLEERKYAPPGRKMTAEQRKALKERREKEAADRRAEAQAKEGSRPEPTYRPSYEAEMQRVKDPKAAQSQPGPLPAVPHDKYGEEQAEQAKASEQKGAGGRKGAEPPPAGSKAANLDPAKMEPKDKDKGK